MAFDDFLKQGLIEEAAKGLFKYSSDILPKYEEPTEEQKAEILAKAKEIESEVAGKFDIQNDEQTPKLNDLWAQILAYWQAPVPFGALPTPPPIALFQQVAVAMSHWLETCKTFQNDADLLAAAGATNFKSYLRNFVDDATKALAGINATPTALMSQSPANFGAGPGADPNFPPLNPFFPQPPMMPTFPNIFGGPMMPPPYGAMSAAPMMPPQFGFGGPMSPMPPMPGTYSPASANNTPDPMVAEMKRQTEALLQMNRDRQKAFDEQNRKFTDYLRS